MLSGLFYFEEYWKWSILGVKVQKEDWYYLLVILSIPENHINHNQV